MLTIQNIYLSFLFYAEILKQDLDLQNKRLLKNNSFVSSIIHELISF